MLMEVLIDFFPALCKVLHTENNASKQRTEVTLQEREQILIIQ